MIANAKYAKGQSRDLPTLADVDAGKVSLDEYQAAHGDDIPEWTDDDFARARPISDFPESMAALKGTRGERGPQRAPVKERIGLRLDPDVVAHFRRTGPGWQSRINAVLMDYVKSEEK